MKQGIHHLLLLAAFMLLAGCFKDELDLDVLNNNPFDAQYQGPSIFVSEGTAYVQVVIGGNTSLVQEVYFRVNEHLFLAPATYNVHVVDQLSGVVSEAVPVDDQGHWVFRRGLAVGQEVCLELSLMNDMGTARPETICVTL